jgi:hypothetical protein
MVHILSCLVAYAFRPGKPSISLDRQQIGAYPNTVHFVILMAATKSIRAVGSGVRGLSG